jgi:hypothetical protein
MSKKMPLLSRILTSVCELLRAIYGNLRAIYGCLRLTTNWRLNRKYLQLLLQLSQTIDAPFTDPYGYLRVIYGHRMPANYYDFTDRYGSVSNIRVCKGGIKQPTYWSEKIYPKSIFYFTNENIDLTLRRPHFLNETTWLRGSFFNCRRSDFPRIFQRF